MKQHRQHRRPPLPKPTTCPACFPRSWSLRRVQAHSMETSHIYPPLAGHLQILVDLQGSFPMLQARRSVSTASDLANCIRDARSCGVCHPHQPPTSIARGRADSMTLPPASIYLCATVGEAGVGFVADKDNLWTNRSMQEV